MNQQLEGRPWNPYLAGALAGVLAVVSVLVTTQNLGSPKYLGASTTFVRAAGLMERIIVPAHVADNVYYREKKASIDWQMLFVIGIFFGAVLASMTDGSFKPEGVPPIWRERFGSSRTVRAVGGLIGGIVTMFGARLAGGCPSGHGLSGMMQLSVSGLIAMICFLIGGLITAALVYRRRA